MNVFIALKGSHFWFLFDIGWQRAKSSNDKIMNSIKKREETTLPTLKEETGNENDEPNRRIKNLEEKLPLVVRMMN